MNFPPTEHSPLPVSVELRPDPAGQPLRYGVLHPVRLLLDIVPGVAQGLDEVVAEQSIAASKLPSMPRTLLGQADRRQQDRA